MDKKPANHNLEVQAESLLMNNYGPAPITLVSAQGTIVTDIHGNEFLDFATGISVTSFGHRNSSIERAVQAQMTQVWHTSNLFYTRPALKLAQSLIKTSFAQRVFFANSGAEVNEAAIKLVRKAVSASRAPRQRNILSFRGGFHGRTLATVTATAQPKYHSGFEPLPEGFRYCDFNDINALDDAFDDTLCAVIFEPIQGEGGINVASDNFVKHLRHLCDQYQTYIIVDEVQSGMARSGKLWAHQWYEDFVPDAMTSAKALGGGLPLGALLVGEQLKDVFTPGSHGSTFGGNPICCAAGAAALELASSPTLLKNVQVMGAKLRSELEQLQRELNVFDEIRGRGLMLGAQLATPYVANAGEIVDQCRHNGLLLLQAGNGVLRFLPPLTIGLDEISVAIGILRQTLIRVFKTED